MATQRAYYEPFAWWLARERIGQDLRERYPVMRDLPVDLLTLVDTLARSESSQKPTSTTSPTLLGKIDSIEGAQLLRACRNRLRERHRRGRSR
jgi:hypothetical protein